MLRPHLRRPHPLSDPRERTSPSVESLAFALGIRRRALVAVAHRSPALFLKFALVILPTERRRAHSRSVCGNSAGRS